MMEPAALGKFTIFGPHTFNFKQTVEALLAGGGAVEVQDAVGLLSAMRRCLSDRDYAAGIAAAGREVILRHQGATDKSLDAIAELLGGGA
jgi:3-deoxy-D-manno-octulosonic-acid transferase